jgi:hypothetical protein
LKCATFFLFCLTLASRHGYHFPQILCWSDIWENFRQVIYGHSSCILWTLLIRIQNMLSYHQKWILSNSADWSSLILLTDFC